jgi:hypothetical protein
VLLVVALVEATALGSLGWVFDLTFVAVCVASALLVRPRDFFLVGVLPPLSMLGIVAVLAASARTAVADPTDGFGQATVSGLAHHAGALVVGYALTLGLLALRQVALRNAGAIRHGARPHDHPSSARSTRSADSAPTGSGRTGVPQQRRSSETTRRVG